MWWLTVALAWAFPVALPTGEDAEAWALPLAAAGLHVGSAETGPHATMEAAGVRWRVTVRDSRGIAHQVVVTPPRSALERADVAWLVASLGRPTVSATALPDLPPLPGPLARPSEVAPPPVSPPPLSPAVAAAPDVRAPEPPTAPSTPALADGAPQSPPAPESEPVATTPASPVDPEEPAPPAPVPPLELPPADVLGVMRPPPADTRRVTPTGLWGRAAVALGLRDEAAAPAAEVAFGPGIGVVRLGLVGAMTAPLALAPAGPERRLRSVDVLAGGWWTPRTGALLGVAAGWSERTWSDGRTLVARDGLPVLAVDAGGALPLGRGVRLLPVLRLQQELATTSLVVDAEPIGTLSPTTVTVRIGIDVTTMDPFSPLDTPTGR